MEITILGAGTWGIALAEVLVANDLDVSVWHYKSNYIEQLSKKKNHSRLKLKISDKIKFVSDSKLISDSSLVLICLPSQSIRQVLLSLKLKNQYYINASKGIELDSGKLISQVIIDTTSASEDTIACISGPSHAEELANRIPTVISVASRNDEFSKSIQKSFSNSFLRLYQSDSIEAMQVGGAVKNIISIASGICAGLGYGDNTIAALITRGIQEIIRFAGLYTHETTSLLGISGIGDLIVTSTSKHSRNKHLGQSVGEGKTLIQALNEMDMVVEGVETTKSVYQMAKKNDISMPICNEVYYILFKNKDPRKAINELMLRELIQE